MRGGLRRNDPRGNQKMYESENGKDIINIRTEGAKASELGKSEKQPTFSDLHHRERQRGVAAETHERGHKNQDQYFARGKKSLEF